MNKFAERLGKALTDNTGSADPAAISVIAVVILGLVALFHI